MEHSGFNVIDLSVLGILVLSGALAFMRGVTREVISLGVWAGAAAATATFLPWAKPIAHAHIKNEEFAGIAAMLALFCLALVILIPLGNLIASFIKGKTLTAIDRSLGFVFGIVRGVLVVSLLYLCISWIWIDQDKDNKDHKPPSWIADAKTRPWLEYGAMTLKDAIPKNKRDEAEDGVRKTKEQADKAIDDARRLQEISTPAPASTAVNTAPSYGSDDRNGLNALIDKKGRP